MKHQSKSLRDKLEECLQQMKCKAQTLRQTDQMKVTFSALMDSTGKEIAAGSGNGDFSEEKSWAECIEHSFFLNLATPESKMSVKDLQQQTGFEQDGMLRNLDHNKILSTTTMESLVSSKGNVEVPLDYISRQKIQYSEPILKKFCSSSGYSFHQSREEALLHGLLEVTERHEFSNALLGRQDTLEIDRLSLPKQIQSEVLSLEGKFHGQIRFFVVRPKFEFLTTIVIFYPNSNEIPIPQTSQKTRHNVLLSLEGALSEMKQILHLYSNDERAEDLSVISNPQLKNNPSIHLKNFRGKPMLKMADFQDTSLNDYSSTQQLSKLIDQITQQGFHPFGRTVFEFGNGCHVTQVFVPGFEKYNLIRLGIDVPIHQQK